MIPQCNHFTSINKNSRERECKLIKNNDPEDDEDDGKESKIYSIYFINKPAFKSRITIKRI